MNRPTISPRGQARGVQRRFPGPGRGWAGAGLGLLLLGIAASASAESWRFEAEGLDPARRHDAGGNPFAIVACSSASGRQALEGLDASGDWVELPVTFERDVCLLDSLRCASPSGITWQFYVEFRPQGSEQIAASDEHDAVPGRGLT